ncbi:MAG: nucleotide exchange factor GrpE [Ruminococcaceae bacterium]|nr:nucleotide exchange factor GrpE [Oscillospiraceae bacterium]
MVEEIKNTPAGEEQKSAPEVEHKSKKQDKKLLAEIEELKAKITEYDDKYLRMAAEYDNFRRRSREEKDAIYETAVADTVNELLPIIDNLDRAANFEDGEKVKEGLQITAKTTASVFEKLGVEEFGKVGDTFDPNLHNAVLHVEDESYGEGEIIEVFQKGYKKGKHIIRFAMVKTAN